jgi:iron(III) transport system permease protein
LPKVAPVAEEAGIGSETDRRRPRGVGDRPRTAPRLLLAAAAVAVLLILIPVVVNVGQAFSGGWGSVRQVLHDEAALSLLGHTLLIAAVVTPLCGVLGVSTAWFLERTQVPGRRVWVLLVVAPLTVPPLVVSMAWVSLTSAMQGYLGAIVITTLTYSPLVFLLVIVALRGLDPALEESARSLGCGSGATFWRVVLPHLRPAILGGLLLVVLDLLVEYDAYAALHIQTFSTSVYAQYQAGSTTGAAVLSCLTTLLCVLFLVAETQARRGANYARVAFGARRAVVRHELGRRKVPVVVGLCALVGASLGVPVYMLVDWFTQSSAAGVAAASGSTNYLGVATLTSVGLGLGAAAVAVLLAVPLALVVTRYRSRLGTLFERGSYLSFALPDLVGALALAYAAVHFARFLYESIPLLILAYAILFVPLAVVAIRASFGQIEPRLEDSARSLGSSGLAVFGRVTLPLSRPGLAAAGFLVFAFAVGDLTTAQVLLPPSMYTLMTQFSANASTVAFAAAAPYAAALIVLALVAAAIVIHGYGRIRTEGAPAR